MRKGLLILAVAVLAMLQTAWAYDFSSTSPSGHTLYYEIISGTTNVGVVRPGTSSTYDNYVTGNVVIPATVTYGGTTYNVTELRSIYDVSSGYDYGSFDGCSGLTSVTIPNSVTSIGNYAFYNCSGLTSVTIPNSVTSIGGAAFYNCSGLTSVTIPNSVTSIGWNAFYYVRHIIYNGTATGSPWGALSVNGYIEGDFVYANNTKTSLLAYIGTSTSVTIPNSVTSIGSSAFRGCSGLTSVTIPNSVTSIGSSAFYDCSGLTSVTIPNSVTSIGDSAFYDCSGLTSVTIPNSVTSIGSSAFRGCSGLTSVTIPNSVTSIGSYAFCECSGLTSVAIPNSVTSIGGWAFYYCSGLTSVTIPNSVTSIGWYAFCECSGLTTLNFNAINCGDFSSSYRPFYNCPIATINIGDSVQRIPACFAYNLESLTSVTIPNSVTSIGWSAFEDCSGLTSVTIPNSVTSIESGTFCGCSGLTSVTIPNSVTSIENGTFYGCSGLTSVTIPNSVTSIGSYAFYNCSGLTSVTIPNSVTSIGSYAFYNCSGLTSVTIPNRVTSIGNWAFNGCTNLRDVTSLAVTPPTLGTTVFSVAGILKVPCGSLSAYRYSAWLDYFTNMEEICNNKTITVISANESMGTVSGSGEYEVGAEVTITATANQGYRFANWNDGNTNNPRTITVAEDATYIASFIAEGSTTPDSDTIVIYDTIVVHDTIGLTIQDTLYLPIYDTVYITDTTRLHDTIYLPQYIHDTTYIVDTLLLTDTIYLPQYIHDTVYIHDTIYITGIENVATINAKIYSSHSRIVVEGANGNNVMLFDMSGRLLATKQDEYSVLEFDVPISGAYFVKIGNYNAKKVVVIK